MRKLAFAGVLFAVTATCGAREVAVQLVHAGHLLDHPGRAMRGPSTLVIGAGKIQAVHAGLLDAVSLGLPADTAVVDLGDKYVLPGLIDSHVHLRSDLGGVEGMVEEFTESPAAATFDALVNARKTLQAGFTTVRNLGDGGGVTLALRDAIAAGKVQGPRILDAGTMISAETGHGDPTLGLREELHSALDTHNLCSGADDCRRAVRQQVARGVDVVKFAATGGVNSRIGLGLGAQLFEDEVASIIQTAHLYGKKVAVHAHGNDGVALAARHKVDSVEHGTLLDAATAKLMAANKVYYVPTLSVINGYKERLAANPDAYTGEVLQKIRWRIDITGQSLRIARANGVRIAFGTDAGVSKHGRNAEEFELLVQFGMTPGEAIQSATVNAADLLGIADQVGTLEPGKTADLIALEANPLADVRALKQVSYVMRAGETAR